MTEIPPECADFWASGYPALRDVEANVQAIERGGYRPVGHFALTASAWWDDYYIPLERNLAVFRERHAGDAVATQVAEETRHEIEMFRKYSRFYGCVFYVMRKMTP